MRNSILTSVMTALVLTGCSSPPTKQPEKDRLTTGQVQLTLRANQTTQTEVLEAFGAPNLVSTNSQGEEVWTYQRNAIQSAPMSRISTLPPMPMSFPTKVMQSKAIEP